MSSISDSDVRDLFGALDLIRTRPGMYLGWSSQQRDAQLRTLEAVLNGYKLALDVHGIKEAGTEFDRRFREFVRERTGWSMSCGAVEAILEHAADEEAWNLFWHLLDEYREFSQRDEQSGG